MQSAVVIDPPTGCSTQLQASWDAEKVPRRPARLRDRSVRRPGRGTGHRRATHHDQPAALVDPKTKTPTPGPPMPPPTTPRTPMITIDESVRGVPDDTVEIKRL